MTHGVEYRITDSELRDLVKLCSLLSSVEGTATAILAHQGGKKLLNVGELPSVKLAAMIDRIMERGEV